jgi:hypothetical protein
MQAWGQHRFNQPSLFNDINIENGLESCSTSRGNFGFTPPDIIWRGAV